MNSDGIARPNPALTPGAAVPGVSVEQVCAPGYASTSRNPGLLDEQSVFQLYLLDYPASLSGHRVDRLIPSELGGADTLPNLWPEPTTPQTAGRKDQLAGWLHQLVCSGAVPLETAQRQVADDWYAAWLRYGGTNSPAPDTLTAVGAPSPNPPAALGAPSGAASVGAPPSAAAGRAPATGAPAVPSAAGAAAVGTVAAPSGPAAPVTAAGAPAPAARPVPPAAPLLPAGTPSPPPSVIKTTTPAPTTPVPTTPPAPTTPVSPTPTQTPATHLIAPSSSAITPPTAPAPAVPRPAARTGL
jgi:hypothetical protein